MSEIQINSGDQFMEASSRRGQFRLDLDRPFQIIGVPQNYAWGRVGAESMVAKLMAEFDATKPYAELWFGCHPNGLSQAVQGDVSLSLKDLISGDPDRVLGDRVYSKFGNSLPFLFKILSVNSALSIQTHPTKSQAEVLHKSKPELYKDDNHKPEIAIPLTPVKMFYGFRPYEEILTNLSNLSEIQLLSGARSFHNFSVAKTENEQEVALKYIYASIMSKTLSDEGRKLLGEACKSLIQKCSTGAIKGEESELVLELAKLYPVDPGLFAPFLMNVVTVNPGEAIYTEPCVPHAYLSGDMVEVMANSDNVVRAGLTPKPCDVTTLIEIVNCKMGMPKIAKSKSEINSPFAEYLTPAEEFSVSVLEGKFEGNVIKNPEPELLFSMRGRGLLSVAGQKYPISHGEALFIPAGISEYSLDVEEGSLFRVRVP
jgi:mannose-6-phosphate isomerase